MSRLACAAAFVGAVGMIAPEVAAHGRFPASGQISVHATAPEQLLVRATYGLLLSPDGGASWRWLCPEAAGFDANKEDPPIALMSDSSVLAGTFDGLSRGSDGACSWAFAGEDLAGRFVVDLQREATPTQALALSSNGLAPDTFDVRLWQTSDSGASWAQAGASPPSDFLATTVAAAPSRNGRVYLAGRDGVGSYQGVVMRSDDRGSSWLRRAVPGADDGQTFPHLGGVHPTDADRVYVVLLRESAGDVVFFELLHSDDGGDNWQSLVSRNAAVTAFAISPDGSEVAFGGRDEGLWVANTSDHQFSQRSALRIGCLTWASSGLYACADPFTDGFVMAVSQDSGATFDPLMALSSPCGPPSCPSDSPVSEVCQPLWPEEALELTAPQSCDGGGASASSTSSGAGGSDVNDSQGPAEDSCSCRATGAGHERPSAWLAALLACAALARRRNARQLS